MLELLEALEVTEPPPAPEPPVDVELAVAVELAVDVEPPVDVELPVDAEPPVDVELPLDDVLDVEAPPPVDAELDVEAAPLPVELEALEVWVLAPAPTCAFPPHAESAVVRPTKTWIARMLMLVAYLPAAPVCRADDVRGRRRPGQAPSASRGVPA